MRIAIFDPSAGVSGDMTLGALLSLGVPASWLEQLPARLGLAGVGVTIRDTRRCGVAAKQVEAEHGRLPVPAPATALLLEGVEIASGGPVEGEATTPTGAALLRVLSAGAPPARWRLVRSGWGAGQRDPKHYANALRLLVAEHAAEVARVVLIASDVDDMSPEYVEPLRQALTTAGALDVQTWPVQMKKGRAGFRIEAVVSEEQADAVTAALFRHSTTAGVRRWVTERATLPRRQVTVQLAPEVSVRVKVLEQPDADGVRLKPEYEDVLAAAQALGRPPLEVARAAQRDAEALVSKSKESAWP